MTEVKLKHGFLQKSKKNLAAPNNNDITKRKPFDINAIGDDEEVVSFENHPVVLAGNRTGSSFYNNGMNVLGPKVNKKFNTNQGNIMLADMQMADIPNGVGRQGTQLKSPSNAQEDKIRNEISLIKDAAKRVNTDLGGSLKKN